MRISSIISSIISLYLIVLAPHQLLPSWRSPPSIHSFIHPFIIIRSFPFSIAPLQSSLLMTVVNMFVIVPHTRCTYLCTLPPSCTPATPLRSAANHGCRIDYYCCVLLFCCLVCCSVRIYCVPSSSRLDCRYSLPFSTCGCGVRRHRCRRHLTCRESLMLVGSYRERSCACHVSSHSRPLSSRTRINLIPNPIQLCA